MFLRVGVVVVGAAYSTCKISTRNHTAYITGRLTLFNASILRCTASFQRTFEKNSYVGFGNWEEIEHLQQGCWPDLTAANDDLTS